MIVFREKVKKMSRKEEYKRERQTENQYIQTYKDAHTNYRLALSHTKITSINRCAHRKTNPHTPSDKDTPTTKDTDTETCT